MIRPVAQGVFHADHADPDRLMRLWIIALAGLVFAGLLIVDPVALAELGYACATGSCGVRPRWLGLGLAFLVIGGVVRHLVHLRRERARARAALARKPARKRVKKAAVIPRQRTPRPKAQARG